MQSATDPLSDPAHFLLMARGLIGAGRTAMLLSLIEQVRARYGKNPIWQAAVQRAIAAQVPSFHSSMLQDQKRNAVYQQALAQLAPGRTVLDIGTGSGLLAMMAARAGAKHVYACEENEILADAARQVIATNCLQDTITVFAKASTDLDCDADLKGGVDLVVSEIMGDDLLGEGMLPSLTHAREQLCLPDAVFIPSRAEMKVALAQFEFPTSPSAMVEGFDLSAHLELLPRLPSVKPHNEAITIRSTPATLFAFDFTMQDTHAHTDTRTVEVTAHGGQANAIAQWIAFEAAPGITYENAPGSNTGLHWRIMLIPIEQMKLEQGQMVALEGHRDQMSALIYPARPQ